LQKSSPFSLLARLCRGDSRIARDMVCFGRFVNRPYGISYHCAPCLRLLWKIISPHTLFAHSLVGEAFCLPFFHIADAGAYYTTR